MTIKEFMESNDIKSKQTVNKWIINGLIPGVKTDSQTNEIIIPDNARPPYTKARAQNSTAIYKSIVKACIERKAVFASLYKISQTEFTHYVAELEDAGFIHSEVIDDITYYYATIKSDEFIKSKTPLDLLQTCLKAAIESATKGAASAMMDKVLQNV